MLGLQRHQNVGRVKGADRGQAQMAGQPSGLSAQVFPGLGLVQGHPLGDLVELGPGLGELNIAPLADEELDTVFRFERADLGGHGRLANAQGLRSGGEAAEFGRCVERPELRSIHRLYTRQLFKLYI